VQSEATAKRLWEKKITHLEREIRKAWATQKSTAAALALLLGTVLALLAATALCLAVERWLWV
jgi:hypothetical protein